MSINFDNQQYRQFVDFAAHASDRTIVKIGKDTVPGDGGDGLSTRNIVARSWDFIGNIGRLSSSSSKNDAGASSSSRRFSRCSACRTKSSCPHRCKTR